MPNVQDAVEDLADLYVAHASARGASRQYIERVADRRARSAGAGVPKAVAARLLGVSVNTLDKWVERGRIKTARGQNGRQVVLVRHLAELLAHVRVLRTLGKTDGVVAAAIAEMEHQDKAFQRQFVELYGASLAAIESGAVKPVELPESFGPDD